jgi:hypothetical protein
MDLNCDTRPAPYYQIIRKSLKDEEHFMFSGIKNIGAIIKTGTLWELLVRREKMDADNT